jgi:NDP-sugar pyrophosphorylase family protein
MLTAQTLFNLDHFAHAALFSVREPVWVALVNLKSYMDSRADISCLPPSLTNGVPVGEHLVWHEGRVLPGDSCTIEYGDTTRNQLVIKSGDSRLEGATLIMAGAILVGNRIELGTGSLVEGGATIKSPAVIGNNTEVRQGAYLRGYCLIGDRCVAGHATEIKHSIFLDDAKAGHFAYVGDSILGANANLGAGTKFANLKFLPGTIKIIHESETLDTNMRKFGAILGDNAQTGCNSVTNPGTIIAAKGMLMPNTTAASGYYKYGSIIR